MRSDELSLIDDYGNVIIKSYHSSLFAQTREYREHHHTECELSMFISGSGEYAVQGKKYEFSSGDVFLFGSNEAHCITEIYEDMEVLNIHFEPRILWEHSDSAELLNIFAARSKSYSNHFPSSDKILAGKICELDRELKMQGVACRVNAKYLLFSILVHMMRNYDCVENERVINGRSAVAKNLKGTMIYINEHLGDNITLKELADTACMTPTYFSSLFKKFNGVSPWKYITIKRVEKAIEMLKRSDLTKIEIAEQCGFSSSSNFYKAFASVTGKKPNDFILN